MVLIGLGGNLPSEVGDPRRTLVAALAELETQGYATLARSPLYRTAPVPVSDQPWFVNAVARLAPIGAPEDLLDVLLAVERRFGRRRGAPNAARTLDLDLLAFEEICHESPRLVLPHPRLHQRAFVLQPLMDIAPDWRHPRSGLSTRQLLAALPPGQAAERLPPEEQWEWSH